MGDLIDLRGGPDDDLAAAGGLVEEVQAPGERPEHQPGPSALEEAPLDARPADETEDGAHQTRRISTIVFWSLPRRRPK